jgi:putative membrane protein
MAQSNQPDKPPNLQIELAKQRNRVAADRTLLAWTRISVSLVGLGFILEEAIKQLYFRLGIDPAITLIPLKIFSLLFVGTGGILIMVAAFDYQGEIKRLQQPEYYYQPRNSLGMIVSAILVAIGISIFVTIFRQSA